MMWGYGYDGWSWLWMAGMMVLFWGGLGTLIFFVVRSFTAAKPSDGALDILRKRFAGGEISQEEFDKSRKALQG